MDGVLADFEGYFCDTFGDAKRTEVDLIKRYPNKEIEIYHFLNDPFVYKDLQPLALGVSIANWLYEEKYEIIIVTGRPKGIDFVSTAWLRKWQVPYYSFISDRPKTGRISLINPLVAVDDFLDVRERLGRSFIPTIIIAQPWNIDFIGNSQRIFTLEQFINEFDKIRRK